MLQGDLQVPRADFESGAGLTGIPDLSSESTFFPLPGDFPPIWARGTKALIGLILKVTVPIEAPLENLTTFREVFIEVNAGEMGQGRG